MIKIDNIVPLTELQRYPGKAVKTAIETKDPVVITQHGKPAVVLVDCETYQQLEKSAVQPSEIEQTISNRERKLRDELQRILLKIVNQFDPEKIILFGSLADGQVRESSDIDLVVVMKTEERYWDRMRTFSKKIRPQVACDIFVYTPEEWEESIKRGRSFASHEIKGKGEVLYERAA